MDGARFGAISTASLPHLAAEVELERSSPEPLGEIEWLPAVP